MLLAEQGGRDKFYKSQGTTEAEFMRETGQFFPRTIGRSPTVFHSRQVRALRSRSPQALTSSRALSAQDYNLNVLAENLQQHQQHYQASHLPGIRGPFDIPVKAKPKQNILIPNRDPQLQKMKDLPKTVKPRFRESAFEVQPSPKLSNEAIYYSQVPLKLEQTIVIKCPKLTGNEQMDFEMDLSKFLHDQQTDKSQSLTHLLQNVNLKAVPKEMFVWLEAIATVLRTMEIPEEEASTLLVLII